MSTPVIEVQHLTKEFRLGQLSGLGKSLRDGLARLRGQTVVPREMFKALDDVNFSIRQGEVVGVIGHNGAGKSTLLKTLAGISQPTRGKVHVEGRVAPLIEVGAGLVADMTGRENVFLNGAILGMRRDEIRRKFDEIVAFAELERFIDTPVKRYSSGMQVRLGFAIATAVDAGILIVDEVLAVGDLAFQRKCYDRIEGFVRDGSRTLLLVSHNLRQVERLCSRVLMFDRGRLVQDGAPKEVCDVFLSQSNAKIAKDRGAAAAAASGRFETSGELTVHAVTVSGARQPVAEPNAVLAMDAVCVEVDFTAGVDIENVVFTVGIHTTDLFFIGTASSEQAIFAGSLTQGRHRLRCVLSGFDLTLGVYAIVFAAEGGRSSAPIFRADNICSFQVVDDGQAATASERFGALRVKSAWTLTAGEASGAVAVEAAGSA